MLRIRFPRLPLLRRFAKDNEAVAVVEFALILPFLLLLFVGSIEASTLITVDRRINIISGTVGDLVARWNAEEGAMPLATLNDYFQASQGIIVPYPATTLKQVVTMISVAADGETNVEWSCGYNGGDERDVNTEYASLPARMNELGRGGWVIASEVTYDYRPVLGVVYPEAINMRNESFYLPRFENEIVGPAC